MTLALPMPKSSDKKKIPNPGRKQPKNPNSAAFPDLTVEIMAKGKPHPTRPQQNGCLFYGQWLG
jgi:hypothetical protein